MKSRQTSIFTLNDYQFATMKIVVQVVATMVRQSRRDGVARESSVPWEHHGRACDCIVIRRYIKMAMDRQHN